MIVGVTFEFWNCCWSIDVFELV